MLSIDSEFEIISNLVRMFFYIWNCFIEFIIDGVIGKILHIYMEIDICLRKFFHEHSRRHNNLSLCCGFSWIIILIIGMISAMMIPNPSIKQYEYFPTRVIISECLNETIEVGRSYIYQSVSLEECFFSRLKLFSGDDGGVINITGPSFTMNISFCTFTCCFCSKDGGAIYFDSINSTITFTCAFNCQSGYGHFAWIESNLINTIDFLSIAKCSNRTEGSFSVMIAYGYQKIENTNSSLNLAKDHSSIKYQWPASLQNSYCTTSNNNASLYTCMRFHKTNGNVQYSNIIMNNSPNEYGILYLTENSKCTFQFVTFAFNHDTLFYISSSQMNLSHCFIYHSGTISNGSLNLFNVLYENHESYSLVFFSTYLCFADNPWYIPSPSIESTLSNTPSSSNMLTQANTPHNTPFQSPKTTHESTIEPTPHRTYDTFCNYQIEQRKTYLTSLTTIFAFTWVNPRFY